MKVWSRALLLAYAHPLRNALIALLGGLLLAAHWPAIGSQPNFAPHLLQLQAKTRQIPLDTQIHYWIDDSAKLSIAQVDEREKNGSIVFQAQQSSMAHKVHDKVLWLRFDIQTLDTQARWLLEIGTPLIDDVQLYRQDAQGQWQVSKAGDVVAREDWLVKTRLPTFYLQTDDSTPVTYYLRVVHRRAPVSLPLLIWRDTELLATQQSETLLLGMFFGLSSLMLIASLGMAALMRDKAFLAYAGYTASLGLFMFTNVGFSALLLWPHSPIVADRAVFFLAATTAAIGPWFVRIVLQPVTRARVIDTLIGVCGVIMLGVGIADTIEPRLIHYPILNMGTLLAILLIYGLVASAWQRGDAATRWVALGFIPVALSAIPLLLRNIGWIPNSGLTQFSLLWGAALEMPVLLYALISRSAHQRDRMMRATGLPTQDALTRLPNLRSLLTQLHGTLSRALRYRHAYGLILVELVNEAWFAKEHGHDMADRALILLADRLQNLSREIDVVSRIDPTHFVILVEGPCTARSLAQLTTRISASAQQPHDALPVGAGLKLKITCAKMPHTDSAHAGDDANAQLGWLIEQADALPTDPRRAVHTIGF